MNYIDGTCIVAFPHVFPEWFACHITKVLATLTFEWICSICTDGGKRECDPKWQHILKYECIGVYTVVDGRTVKEFFETT